jgi:hypothetical protein
LSLFLDEYKFPFFVFCFFPSSSPPALPVLISQTWVLIILTSLDGGSLPTDELDV